MRASRNAGLALAALIALPVVIGAAYATFAAVGLVGAGARGATSAALGDVLTDVAMWRGLGWSLWIAAASTVGATAIAVSVAVTFRGARTSDRVGRALAIVPLPVPHVVAGLLGVQLLGQSGWIARVAHASGVVGAPADMPALVYDPYGAGLILTMIWKETPFLAVVAIALLHTRGAAAEEAAHTLGASRLRTLQWVTIPLVLRGLLPAVIAVFVFVFGNFEVAALLAPSDPLALPLLIEERALDPDLTRRAGAYVTALVALAAAALAVAVHAHYSGRWSAEHS
ncbi:MAG: ABC transporter permease subunit [Gemmatimonadaceae bacterium]|nr:ABC transporter permease subunit [Gemmatimonadaceae bacterium]